jgi:Sec-independent protein secretion pathway component TatC
MSQLDLPDPLRDPDDGMLRMSILEHLEELRSRMLRALAGFGVAYVGIVILAALVTPSPDAFNLTLFAVPMILLYFLGVFVSYLLVLRREGRKFPWKIFLVWLLAMLAVVGIGMAYMGYWRLLIK